MRRLVLSLRSPTEYSAKFVGLRASAPTYTRLTGYQVIFREIRLSERGLSINILCDIIFTRKVNSSWSILQRCTL